MAKETLTVEELAEKIFQEAGGMEIRLRGYELSLRKQEAALVFVEKGVEA